MVTRGKTYSETFPAVADSVPTARAAVSGIAHQAGARGERLDAIRLASSEAITNVVLHAYAEQLATGGVPGTIHVTVSVVEDEVWILVADEGGGLRSRTQSRGLGLGLALIAQLADDFQVLRRGEGGTELRMRFKLRSAPHAPAGQPRGSVSVASVPA